MSIYMDTIVGLSKVLVAYFVLFFIIPACVIKFDEENENFLDKMYISIIHSNIAVIIIVHILVLLKIYEPISFVISYLAVIVVYVFLRDKKELTGIGAYNETKRANMGLIVKLLDLWESELGFRGTMLKGAKTWIVNVFSTMINILKNFIYNPIESIALVAIIYIAAYVRFRHSIVNFYYGASDAYVHLAWTKYMGNNDIYRDGVYPYGYNALISALNKAFLIDPVVIIRFIGALGGMLIVLSVYYVLKRNFKGDKIIPIVGIAFYVLSTQLPQNTWRQMSALPQEYATLLFLPGLHFLNMYFKDFKKHYLYLAAEVLAISLFIHLYVGLFVVIGYIIICIVNLKSFFNITFTLRFAITMILSGVLGVLPMGIGLASGMKIHKQSAQFVIESAGTKESANTGISLFSFNEPDASLKLLVMLILVLIFISFIRIWIEKKPEKLHIVKINLSFSLMALVLYSQYRAVELGLPATMEFSRVGIFLSLVSVVVIALLLDVFDLFIKFKPINYILKLAVIIPIFLTLFNYSNFSIPVGAKLEYNEAAQAYMKIKKEFPILNWTIISPVEQYQQSFGYGWHYNLWEFVQDVIEDAKEEVKIPTDYVFLFVEKYPLNSTQRINEQDSAEKFPIITGQLDKYYTEYNNRRIIEAKAYYWAEEYIKEHDFMKVYMDTEVMTVYMIKQDGEKPYNLAN